MSQQFPPPPDGGVPVPGTTPPPQAQPLPRPAAPSTSAAEPKVPGAVGFLKSLVDFSFAEFVSPRVLKILYGIYLFMLIPQLFGLFAAWYVWLSHESYDLHAHEETWDPQIGMFCGSFFAFPIFVFVYVLLGRVLFERGILAFRQHQVTKELLSELRARP